MTPQLTHPPLKNLLVWTIAVLGCLGLAATAQASPTAPNIAIIEAQCDPAKPAAVLRDQLLASGASGVTFFNAATSSDDGPETIPTASELAAFDAAVIASDCPFFGRDALGDSLADFQDAGGVVIASGPWSVDVLNYPEASIGGRWLAGGYSPAFVEGEDWGDQTLVPVDPTQPIFAGTGELTGFYLMNLTLNPGAQTLATWTNGFPAVVVKSRAVVVNALLGDHNMRRTGDYGRLFANLIRFLGKQPLTVTKTGNGKGTVTGTVGGLNCGTLCTVYPDIGAAVQLTAAPVKGSTFIGWSGACSGTATCSPVIAYPGNGVSAEFALNTCKVGKLKKRKLNVKVPGAGKLVLTAPGVKKVTKKITKTSTVKLTLKPTGKVKKKLAKSGKAKVKLKLTYTPTGGKSGTTKKTVTIK